MEVTSIEQDCEADIVRIQNISNEGFPEILTANQEGQQSFIIVLSLEHVQRVSNREFFIIILSLIHTALSGNFSNIPCIVKSSFCTICLTSMI